MNLTLSLLGPVKAQLNERRLPESRTKKVEALLIYLVTERARSHSRAYLAELLFSELAEDVSNTNFRQTLTRLRRAIQDTKAEPPFLLTTRESLQFNVESSHWLDVAEFRKLANGCSAHHPQIDEECLDCMTRLQAAAALYRGPFLEGFRLDDSDEFERWAEIERQQLQKEALALLQRLATYHEERGEYDDAVGYVEQVLGLEPWQEAAHRQLMRLYAFQGNRSGALIQFKRCTEILAAELDVPPMPQTVALYERIKAVPKACPHNLPAMLSHFIGRREQIAQIHRQLANSQTRLLTLFGPGGIGKTRLALQIAHRFVSLSGGPFLDGIYFVSLENLHEAPNSKQTLLFAIADALGVVLNGVKSPLQSLLNHLDGRRILLVVDNCEGLDDALTVLDDLLQKSSGLKILATSREALQLYGEVVVNLDGLTFPPLASSEQLSTRTTQIVKDMAHSPRSVGTPRADSIQGGAARGRAHYTSGTSMALQCDSLAAYSAIQLFYQQAQLLDSSFSLDSSSPEERAAIVQICQLTEGQPLAIEMAAALISALPCAEIAAEIDHNLDVLRASQRRSPARQRTLRAVFDYSWQLLNEAERTMYAQLSVFGNGFTRDAVKQILGVSVTEFLALVHKSLVRFDRVQDRYSIHPLLYQYATEKLAGQLAGRLAGRATGRSVDADPASATIYDAHTHYYAAWLDELTPALQGGRQQETVARVGVEIENIRRAWLNALRNNDIEIVGQLVDGLAHYYELRGLFEAGEAVFASAEEVFNWTPEFVRTRATIMARRGRLSFLLGKTDIARELLTSALAHLEPLAHDAAQITPLNHLAYLCYCSDQYIQAQEYCHQAKRLSILNGDRLGVANAQRTLASSLQALGNYDEAIKNYQNALNIYQSIGNLQGECWSVLSLGACARIQGNYEEAIARVNEAIALCRTLGFRLPMGWAFYDLGYIYAQVGDDDAAFSGYQQALEVGQEIGDLRIQGVVMNALGRWMCNRGDLASALEHYDAALKIYREIENHRGQGEALNNLGSIARYMGQLGESVEKSELALSIGQSIQNRELQYRSLINLGHTFYELRQLPEAKDAYDKALHHVEETGRPQLRSQALAGLAMTLLAEGDIETAFQWVTEFLGQMNYLHHDVGETFRIDWCCYAILNEAQDGRADTFLQRSYERLMVHLDRLSSECQVTFSTDLTYPKLIVAAYSSKMDVL